MREEETIRKELNRMMYSQYRDYYADKIGALSWVLGESTSIRQGAINSRKQPNKEE